MAEPKPAMAPIATVKIDGIIAQRPRRGYGSPGQAGYELLSYSGLTTHDPPNQESDDDGPTRRV